MAKPTTLGELKQSPWGAPERRRRSVKQEMRENLIRALESGEAIFPGIIGFGDTAIPQLTNAILAKQNLILLGLRGQAKSRILRALADFLDPELPAVAGCEINDNPFAPLCRSCKLLLGEGGDATPIAWIPREARYV